MKKLILAITLAAFTLGAYGGDSCCPASKDKAAGDKDQSACPASKEKSPTSGDTAKKDVEKKDEAKKDSKS